MLKYLSIMTLEIKIPEQPKKAITNKRAIIIATVCFVVGLILFIVAYIGINNNTALGSFNQPFLDWIVNHRSPLITNIAKVVTKTTEPEAFSVVVVLFAIFWAIKKRKIWQPLLLAGSMAAFVVISTLIKHLVQNARPSEINMILPLETGFSFPSGHTIAITVFLLVIGYLLYSRNFSNKRVLVWSAVTIVGVSIIALSRLYLGYHWLTDITASIGLGLIILAVIIAIDRIVINKFKNLK